MQTFRDAARSKDFAFSAEIFLRPEMTAEMIAIQCGILRDHVDGILVTDNQDGQLHMSPVAAASLLLANGVDPIVQLTTRNRNRIALLGELFGAAALGVSSLVLVRGNRVPDGFDPRPRAVFDVDAKELIAMACNMREDEDLLTSPEFFVGSVITPHVPKPGWIPIKLTEKADAGAQFMQTHICMDTALLREYMKHLVASGIPRRLSVLVKLAVLSSADDARWLRDSLPNNQIPDDVILRLEQAADAEQEGVRIVAEQLRELATIPGVAGAHLVATRQLPTIVAAIEASGIAKGD